MADHAFVVPAYGDSPFLPACLASLTGQTLVSRVVVTTSTPSTFIAERAVAAGAPVIVNPERAGIAADWNFALAATDARYVTLAHQDDVYFPAFLTESLELLAGNARAALSFTGYVEIDDHGVATRSKISFVKHAQERLALGAAREPSPGRLRAFLSFGNPLPCSSVTFDRDRLAGFVFSDAFRSNLDWDAWLNLAEAGVVFARTPHRLVGRRHNPLTATSTLIREGVRAREDLAIFRRLWPRPLADLIAFAYRAGY
ncbi:MAG: glycosyltransferase family 2 protein [Caulobacteraceae bacterium]|jgi:glycosyltransferase involved in cell wall biosynthesis